MSFTWQYGRQLRTLTNSQNVTSTYTYNSDGTRTAKNVGGAWSYYKLDGDRIMTMISPFGSDMHFDYDESGNVYSVNYNNADYYYIRNGQNDITGIIDSSGATVVSYVYDTWGNLISVSGSMAETLGKANPFRYRGYFFDEESGLYYCQSRYYDPVTSRFLNADGYVNADGSMTGLNMYAHLKGGKFGGAALMYYLFEIGKLPVYVDGNRRPPNSRLVGETPTASFSQTERRKNTADSVARSYTF